jgi:hypothetical protein
VEPPTKSLHVVGPPVRVTGGIVVTLIASSPDIPETPEDERIVKPDVVGFVTVNAPRLRVALGVNVTFEYGSPVDCTLTLCEDPVVKEPRIVFDATPDIPIPPQLIGVFVTASTVLSLSRVTVTVIGSPETIY